MSEDQSPKTRTQVFKSGRPGLGDIVWGALFVFAIAALAAGIASPLDPAGPIVVLIAVLGTLVLKATSRWTAEIDMAARRLTISRRLLGRWTTVIANASFDECSKVLACWCADSSDRFISLEFRRGGRYEIPVERSRSKEAAAIASELSSLTGIPRGHDEGIVLGRRATLGF
jgi:hypothetical protein